MKKILIIEDNEAIVKGLKYSLEQEKFNVSVRYKCKKGKRHFRK
ncbi:MAG: response regulator [Clostridia bacterium]|nr:response regulator [Clostridia bacterium]